MQTSWIYSSKRHGQVHGNKAILIKLVHGFGTKSTRPNDNGDNDYQNRRQKNANENKTQIKNAFRMKCSN